MRQSSSFSGWWCFVPLWQGCSLQHRAVMQRNTVRAAVDVLTVWVLQDGWKAWKRALKQSNALDDDGEQDAASLAAAKMVAAANRRFEGKGKSAADIPFSMLHKVRNGVVML